jgi:hypothetical protein
MKERLPQEIEVWELLPAIRKALSKVFVNDFKLSRKEAAKLLHITEPAISQYLREKRANKLKFGYKVGREIHISAERVLKGDPLYKEINRISRLHEVRKQVCKIHRDSDTNIPRNCAICFEV